MVSSQTLTEEVLTEIAEAADRGLKAEELVEIEHAISSDAPLSAEKVKLRSGEVRNQGFTYIVPPTEAAQWIAAWRMEVGRDGIEYGRPTKLNIQQLGLHLSRRRMDGGRLFVISMPERVVPAGRFECFAVPDQCKKRLNSKGMLLDHIENFHPTAARHFHEELEVIRKSMNADNLPLRRTVEQLAAMSDDPWVVTPEAERQASAEAVAEVNVSAGAEPADELSVNPLQFACEVEGCGWTPKPGTGRPSFALQMHTNAKHRI